MAMFPPWSREDCQKYVKARRSEIPALADEKVYNAIIARLTTCRDPEGNMLRMLNAARGLRRGYVENERWITPAEEPYDAEIEKLIGGYDLEHEQLTRAALHVGAERLPGRDAKSTACGWCGATFEPKRSTAQFCSARCRVGSARQHGGREAA